MFGGAAGGEEREAEDEPGERVEPVRQGVQAGERHVGRADHERHEEVAEPGEDRDDDEEHHPRPVHRDDLVVGVARHDAAVGVRELRADQQREEAGDGEEEPGGRDVEDPDPLVVDGDEPARHAAALPGGDRSAARP